METLGPFESLSIGSYTFSVERQEEGVVVLRLGVFDGQRLLNTRLVKLLAPVGFTIPLEELTK